MAVAYYNYIRRRNPNLHRERIFRDIDNPLDYLDDTDIICKYRLPRHNIIDLCGRFNRDLRRPTLRSRPLPVSLQVMVALNIYATGSFQAVLGDVHRISRPSVFRITNNFTYCLVRLSPEYVKCLPKTTQCRSCGGSVILQASQMSWVQSMGPY